MQPPRHSGCGWLQLARIQREPSGPVLSGGQRAEILTAESSALPSREKSCDGEELLQGVSVPVRLAAGAGNSCAVHFRSKRAGLMYLLIQCRYNVVI